MNNLCAFSVKTPWSCFSVQVGQNMRLHVLQGVYLKYKRQGDISTSIGLKKGILFVKWHVGFRMFLQIGYNSVMNKITVHIVCDRAGMDEIAFCRFFFCISLRPGDQWHSNNMHYRNYIVKLGYIEKKKIILKEI